MSGQSFEVPPMSRANIRRLAKQVRASLGVTEARFPIVEYMEIYDQIDKDFVYDIRTTKEMGTNHGITYPDKKLMLIREDVYNGAAEGKPRDRMTIAHEFGHLHMHANLGLSRQLPRGKILTYRSSEWQANCFGGELLVSADHAPQCSDPIEAMQVFGVSWEAANIQWEAFKREGIVK